MLEIKWGFVDDGFPNHSNPEQLVSVITAPELRPKRYIAPV
jgi:hypothetical protein